MITQEGIVDIVETNGVQVVRFLSGQVREETAVHRALEEIGVYIDNTPGSKIVVNAENLEYLSSAGLGNLVGLLKKARKTNGVFRICCLQETIKELFEVMRLNKIFEIFESEDDALASF